MSIWDFAPRDIVGGWECRYEHEGLWARIRGRGPWSSSGKWKEIRSRLDELSKTNQGIKQAVARWSMQEPDLTGYKLYEPVMDIDLRQASSEVVNAELQRRIDQQASRIEELRMLVTPWGIDLDRGIASLDALNLWFATYLHLFTKREFLAHVRENKDPHCDPYHHRTTVVWYSIALDISLYMMSMLQAACPSVHWGVSKQNLKWAPLYNRPVLIYTANTEPYADYEGSLLWQLMSLLGENYITRDLLSSFSREYKKTLAACQRQVKKMAKVDATTNGDDGE